MNIAQARWLVGRKIVAYRSNPFAARRGVTGHDPSITLDNGATLRFVVEETETGEYGVAVIYCPAKSSTK